MDCVTKNLNINIENFNEFYIIWTLMQILFTLIILFLYYLFVIFRTRKRNKSVFLKNQNSGSGGGSSTSIGSRKYLKFETPKASHEFFDNIFLRLSKKYSFEAIFFITIYMFYEDLINGISRSLLLRELDIDINQMHDKKYRINYIPGLLILYSVLIFIWPLIMIMR